MYHPPIAPPGSLYETEDFEYLEFKNTGPTNLNLAGVHFTNGLEFAFPASTLAPGAYVLVVRKNGVASALLYLAAMAAKEIFVPLIALLAFIPERRPRRIVPHAVALVVYAAWHPLFNLGRSLGNFLYDQFAQALRNNSSLLSFHASPGRRGIRDGQGVEAVGGERWRGAGGEART